MMVMVTCVVMLMIVMMMMTPGHLRAVTNTVPEDLAHLCVFVTKSDQHELLPNCKASTSNDIKQYQLTNNRGSVRGGVWLTQNMIKHNADNCMMQTR